MDQSVPVADRLLGRYGAGSLASIHDHVQRLRQHAEDLELPTPQAMPHQPQFSLVIMEWTVGWSQN